MKKAIETSRVKGHEVETEIANQTHKWNELYKQQSIQLKNHIEASVSQTNLNTIHGLVEQIKANEDEITSLQQEIIVAQS